jgi:DUF4097 and DUF4098 domain-containing protein YvlB
VGGARVSTASGDVQIGRAESSVRASTASGDVSIGTPRRGEVEAKTVSGDVALRVPAGTGVWLDLSTLTGSTRTDLNIGTDAPASSPDLTVRVATMSGDIEVYRTSQPAPAS